jgi:class 3 adenylate cyclase
MIAAWVFTLLSYGVTLAIGLEVYHDLPLTRLMNHLLPNRSFASTREDALARPTTDWFISAFDVEGRKGPDSFPMGVLPVCIGYKAPYILPALTRTSLINLFIQNSSATVFGLPTSAYRIFIPDAPDNVLRSIVLRYLGNPDISSKVEKVKPELLADVMMATPNSFAIISPFDAVTRGLPCLGLLQRTPKTSYDVALPRLDYSFAECYSLEAETGFVLTSGKCTQAYPMVGALYTTTGMAACDDNVNGSLDALLHDYSASLLSGLSLFGGIPLSYGAASIVQDKYLRKTCSPIQANPLYVDPTVSRMFRAITYFIGTNNFSYFNVTSENETVSPIGFVLNQTTPKPGRHRVPFAMYALSVVYNIGYDVALTIPECVLLGIATGKIEYWDHPLIQEVNPFVPLPHEKIIVVVGANDPVAGDIIPPRFAKIESTCNLPATASQTAPPNTPRPQGPGVSDSDTPIYFVEAGNKVRSTPYSIGFAVAGTVDANEAQIVTADGLLTGNNIDILGPDMGKAVFNPKTRTMDVTKTSNYPFLGLVYAEYPTQSKVASCANVKVQFNFLRDVLLSATVADNVARSLGFVKVSYTDALQIVKAIDSEAYCNGNLIYPVVVVAPVNIAETIITVVLLIGLMSAIMYAVTKACNLLNFLRHWHAPKSSSKPLCIMFTDIQSSTMLWNRYPPEMENGIAIHHKIIRKCIVKHNGYEVKTIGDAFMVAFSRADNAVACALAIQEKLLDTDWGTDNFDELYGEPPSSQWHGLRVRIGIHCGVGNVQWDDVTKRYDYYGTVVNAAARVESLGHGGQTLVTEDVWTAVMESGNSKNIVLERMGERILRGIDRPVEILQIATWRLAKRTFPDLVQEITPGSSTLEIVEAGENEQSQSNPLIVPLVMPPLSLGIAVNRDNRRVTQSAHDTDSDEDEDEEVPEDSRADPHLTPRSLGPSEVDRDSQGRNPVMTSNNM